MLHGFRAFIARGNVIDLAVGVIIGAAFGSIVNSLVGDVITPVIGMVGGRPDFSSVTLGPIGIGKFLNALIAFLLQAAALYFFIVVPFTRFMAKVSPPPSPAPAGPTPTEKLLTEIRDSLGK